MEQRDPSAIPLLQRVFHPSDFSEAGDAAFAHVLVIALMAKATLTILHVSESGNGSWTDFPGVRETLERWRLLPKSSERADVSKLGINVHKVQMSHSDPVESITTYLDAHGTDLIVLATDQQKWGIPRLASGLHREAGMFTLLHVGEEDAMLSVTDPEVSGWHSSRMSKSGEVIDVVNQVAKAIDADLIVMTTDGRNDWFDAMRGSHSERVLQESGCPLHTIPVDGWMASVL